MISNWKEWHRLVCMCVHKCVHIPKSACGMVLQKTQYFMCMLKSTQQFVRQRLARRGNVFQLMWRCWGIKEDGIVSNWWKKISLTKFYVTYYSQKNVFPILFNHVILCSNAIFGNPRCKQIISENLTNRCSVWLESTENSQSPQCGSF